MKKRKILVNNLGFIKTILVVLLISTLVCFIIGPTVIGLKYDERIFNRATHETVIYHHHDLLKSWNPKSISMFIVSFVFLGINISFYVLDSMTKYKNTVRKSLYLFNLILFIISFILAIVSTYKEYSEQDASSFGNYISVLTLIIVPWLICFCCYFVFLSFHFNDK